MATKTKKAKVTKKTPRIFYITAERDWSDEFAIWENDPGMPEYQEGWRDVTPKGECVSPCKEGAENVLGMKFGGDDEDHIYKARLVLLKGKEKVRGAFYIRRHNPGNVEISNYDPNNEREDWTDHSIDDQEWLCGYKAFRSITGLSLKERETIRCRLEILEFGVAETFMRWRPVRGGRI